MTQGYYIVYNSCNNMVSRCIDIQWNVNYPDHLSAHHVIICQQKIAESSYNVSIIKNPKKQKRTVLSIEDKLVQRRSPEQ